MILKFSTAESLRAATYLSPAIKCSRSTNFNVSSTTFWPQQSPKNNLFYYNRNILAKLKEGIFRLIFKLKAMINGHQIESQYIRRLCDQWLYYMSNCVIYLKAYFCMSGLDPYWTTERQIDRDRNRQIHQIKNKLSWDLCSILHTSKSC